MAQLFIGRVAVGNYEWVDALRDRKNPQLLSKASGKDSEPFLTESPGKTYDPFSEQPDLYLKLVNLKLGKVEIQDFASRYGALTNGELLKTSDRGAPGVSLSAWRDITKSFRRDVASYEKNGATRRVVERINRAIKWTARPYITVDRSPGMSFIVDRLFPIVFLQLASRIAAVENELGRCKECGAIIEIQAVRRNKREFCDGTCRQRFSRRTKS